MCSLCNKEKDIFVIRLCPYHKGELILYTREHRPDFTREEVGLINTMFPHNAKRWKKDKEYNDHAHVHLTVGKNLYKPPSLGIKLPKNMLESRAVPNLGKYAKEFLKHQSFNGTKMLEIGSGIVTNHESRGNFWELEYWSLDILPNDNKRHIVGDIQNCPQVESGSFDFVYSMDLFEHLTNPFKAVKEISRITKRSGIIFISTVFAWRYHEVPVDYWRYSPHCLAYLFQDNFDCLQANWDISPRRGLDEIGIQGNGKSNDIVPTDEFGAWRENWRVYFVGFKARE